MTLQQLEDQARQIQGRISAARNPTPTVRDLHANRDLATNERSQLQERLLQIDQQRLEVQRRLNQQVLAQTQSYHRLYEQASRAARAEADAHRQETRSSRQNIALMRPHEQFELLDIARRAQANPGRMLSRDDLDQIRGLNIFSDVVARQAELRAQQTGVPDQLMQVLGRPQQQANLDREATRLEGMRDQLNRQVEQMMAQQGQLAADTMRNTILPQLADQQIRIGQRMADMMREAMNAQLVAFAQRLQANQNNVAA